MGALLRAANLAFISSFAEGGLLGILPSEMGAVG